jgi:hypothetical protein
MVFSLGDDVVIVKCSFNKDLPGAKGVISKIIPGYFGSDSPAYVVGMSGIHYFSYPHGCFMKKSEISLENSSREEFIQLAMPYIPIND